MCWTCGESNPGPQLLFLSTPRASLLLYVQEHDVGVTTLFAWEPSTSWSFCHQRDNSQLDSESYEDLLAFCSQVASHPDRLRGQPATPARAEAAHGHVVVFVF